MIKIEITVPDHISGVEIDDYIGHALFALGYAKTGNALGQAKTTAGTLVERIRETETAHRTGFAASVSAIQSAASDISESELAQVVQDAVTEAVSAIPQPSENKPKRERGKPDPTSGRTRRTKIEIAEDDAADAADAAAGITRTAPTEDDGSQAQAEAIEANEIADAAIVAETPAESAETIAQDEADEAKESATSADKKTITGLLLDQVRKTMGEIAKKHGIPMAARIPEYLGKPVAEFAEADLPGVLKKVTTLLKLDTETAQAILGEEDETPASIIANAKTETEVVAADLLKKSEYPATREELIKAMFRYADYADGTRDQEQMKFTMQDVPQMFQKSFGVEKQGQIPDDKVGEAIALLDNAIATDRFKRKRS